MDLSVYVYVCVCVFKESILLSVPYKSTREPTEAELTLKKESFLLLKMED